MFNMPVLDDQEERAGVRMEGNIKMWVLDATTGQEVGPIGGLGADANICQYDVWK